LIKLDGGMINNLTIIVGLIFGTKGEGFNFVVIKKFG
jgi:hypothetical protein